MTPAQCEALVASYVGWLRQGLRAEMVGGSCELVTPFLDRHNDHLQIYATRTNGEIVLSDDGYVLADLAASGVEIKGGKRLATLTSVLNGFGVKRDAHDALYVSATEANLGQRVHGLVQAMLAVNDMFMTAKAHVASLGGAQGRKIAKERRPRVPTRSPRGRLPFIRR